MNVHGPNDSVVSHDLLLRSSRGLASNLGMMARTSYVLESDVIRRASSGARGLAVVHLPARVVFALG